MIHYNSNVTSILKTRPSTRHAEPTRNYIYVIILNHDNNNKNKYNITTNTTNTTNNETVSLRLNETLNLISDDETLTQTFDKTFEIVSIVIIALSIVLDSLSYGTIIYCKKKLIKVEFFILLTANILLTLTKLINLAAYVLNSNTFVTCFIYYSLSIDVSFCYYSILFFYSMFHLSNISRSIVFQKMFSFVHSPKVFLVYCLVILVGTSAFIFSYSYWFRFSMFTESKNGKSCGYVTWENKILFPPFALNISFATTLVYFVATVYTKYSQWVTHKRGVIYSTDKMNDFKRQRRFLLVMAKFCLFSIFTCLLSMSQNLPIIIYYFSVNTMLDTNLMLNVMGLIFDCLVMVDPIFLIIIQNILRKNFKKLIQMLLGKFLALFN